MEDIEISNIDISMFQTMTKLNVMYLKKFYYCTFVPKVLLCFPKTDGISTSTDLLGRPILRITVWIVAFVTCIGNIYVFWGRLTTRDENKVLNWIVRNLAGEKKKRKKILPGGESNPGLPRDRRGY